GHLTGVKAVEDFILAACQSSNERRFIVKLDLGQAGEGNAIVDLTQHTTVTEAHVQAAVANAKTLGHAPLSKDAYHARLNNEGGVVEHFLPGPLREASGKIRMTPTGDEIIGVHMQCMGQGETNSQSFVGGVAPADADCAPHVTQQLRTIAAAVRKILA